ncbi:MAG: PAS domain-containing protein, partial [Limisphaerales bacterium]
MPVQPKKLLERIPFPASLTDGRNRFVAINSAHENLYGRKEEELTGQSPTRLVAKSVKKARLQEILTSSGKEGWHGSIMNVDRRGREFEVVLHTRPVWLGNRKLKLGVACRAGEEEALIRS